MYTQLETCYLTNNIVRMSVQYVTVDFNKVQYFKDFRSYRFEFLSLRYNSKCI